jgi:hypothetical protein
MPKGDPHSDSSWKLLREMVIVRLVPLREDKTFTP